MSEYTVDEVKVEETQVEEAVAEEKAEAAVTSTKTSKDKAKKAKKDKTKKKSWFKGLKAEFKNITWPPKKTLLKQTIAVIVCSVVLGAIIKVIDELMQYGINFLVK